MPEINEATGDRVAPPLAVERSARAAVDLLRDTTLVDQLYAEFSPYIHSLIRRLVDDQEARRDLTGESYLLFRSLLDRYDPARGVPLRPYLIAQLRAHLYSRCRSRRSILRRETCIAQLEAFPSHASDPTLTWHRDIEISRLICALPKLLSRVPNRQRTVIVWRYFDGAGFDDIAQRLGVRPATARSLLRHGLNRLRELASAYDG